MNTCKSWSKLQSDQISHKLNRKYSSNHEIAILLIVPGSEILENSHVSSWLHAQRKSRVSCWQNSSAKRQHGGRARWVARAMKSSSGVRVGRWSALHSTQATEYGSSHRWAEGLKRRSVTTSNWFPVPASLPRFTLNLLCSQPLQWQPWHLTAEEGTVLPHSTHWKPGVSPVAYCPFGPIIFPMWFPFVCLVA